MKNYESLEYKGKIYTDENRIKGIVRQEGLDWLLKCEIENASIKINNQKLIWKSGVFHNGTWLDGIFS